MDTTRPPWADLQDTQAHRVVSRYIRVVKLHRGILDQKLRSTGVYRGQHQILMQISDHPHASQTEIAEKLEVSTATIAVSVKKLEKAGYISRQASQSDNRFNQICVTPKGEEIVKKSRCFFKEVEEQMFWDFTEEELRTMECLLDRIYTNLTQIARASESEGR